MRCGCGNELMTGDIEGICTRCRNVMNQAKQWPQNLPKADAYSLLAEVREIVDRILNDYDDIINFERGLKAIKKKLDAHFS